MCTIFGGSQIRLMNDIASRDMFLEYNLRLDITSSTEILRYTKCFIQDFQAGACIYFDNEKK